MNSPRKSIWLRVVALVIVSLIVSGCGGGSTTAQECTGNLWVADVDVSRVEPAPAVAYAISTWHSWDDSPYAVEVTNGGEADLHIYYNGTNVAIYKIYDVASGSSQLTVDEWNGFKKTTLNVGNFVIEDTESKCEIEVTAGHEVEITSTGTKYVVTVRPDINQVIVGVLDGKVEVTSQGQTVTLDAAVPTEAMVVVTDGNFGPLLPIPDPDQLEQEVSTGQDIPVEQGPETPFEPSGVDSLTMWADERLMPVLEEIGAQFEADTGIQLLIEPMSLSDISDKYATALRAGNAPDLVTVQHQQIYELAASGSVLPMKMGMDPDLLIPGTIQAFSYKGDTYGAPYAYDNLALVSNPELVPEISSTWSELLRYTAEISKGREFFTGLMIPSGGYFFYPVQSAFGGYIFGTYPDGTFDAQDLGMMSEGSLAAASWFEELVKSQSIFQGDEETALKYFQGGNAAMIVTGPWRLQLLREMGVPFQVSSFPREVQESQPFLGVYGFLISRSSQAPEAAQNLLWNYLTTYQAVQVYSNILGIPPARRDVLENLEDADLRAFGFAGEYGIPIPYLPEMDAVWGPWTDALQAIISQEMSAEEAFRNANAIIQKEIGQ